MNIAHSTKSPHRGAAREIGLTGAGKGDKPRSWGRRYTDRLDEVNMGGSYGELIVDTPNKKVYRYAVTKKT